MRILLFPSAYAPAVGGVEESTRRLTVQLRAAGDTVEVWTNRHPVTLAARSLIEGTSVRRFALPLPRMSVSAIAGFPFAATGALLHLRHAASEARPDLVHVHCFSANGVYATALAAWLDIPLVITLHGETVMDDGDIYEHSAALRAGLRLGLRRANAVTACSRFVLEDAERRFGLPLGSGKVVPGGVDTVAPERHVPLALPFGRFVLGLGRTVEKKGFDLLLSAFSRVATDHPGVGLVIGGDGPARSDLKHYANALGLANRVVLPGMLSRGQVAWAMGNASVFVLPSRIEPFGLVVLEALRAGRPVVVSSHGGAPEIVRHERDGLVVDPFDPEATAAAISLLLNDKALSHRLAAVAPARAQEFSWGLIAKRYRTVYSEVAEA